jgi:hypothetical protein
MVQLYIVAGLNSLITGDTLPLILTTKPKKEVMILDIKESDIFGISSENELPSSLSCDSMVHGGGGTQHSQSGHLIKLPFRVDVAHGQHDINIVEWQSGANQTEMFVNRGDLIKIGNGGHIVQVSRSKIHTASNLFLMHPYTHISASSVDVYLVAKGKGIMFGPDKDLPSVVTMNGIDDLHDSEQSYLLIGTTTHGLLRPQILFSDGNLQFLSRNVLLSVLHGAFSVEAAGEIQMFTRKDITLEAGTGSKESATPRGSITLSANSVKGISINTQNEESEKETGSIQIRTGSSASPQSSPGTIHIIVGTAGVGSKGGVINLRSGNVTGDVGIGGALRMFAGDAPGNFQSMEDNNAIGGEATLSSGSGLTRSGNLNLFTGSSQYKSGDVMLTSGSAGRGASGNVHIATADAYLSGNISLSIGRSKLKKPGSIILDGNVMIQNKRSDEKEENKYYNLGEKIHGLEMMVKKQNRLILGLLNVLDKMNGGNDVLVLQSLVAEAEATRL